jgi:hypothetical protein
MGVLVVENEIRNCRVGRIVILGLSYGSAAVVPQNA